MALRGPDQRRKNESQSAPSLFFFRCLYVNASIAAPGFEGHKDGSGSMQYDPIEAFQNRCPGENQHTQGLGIVGERLSLSGSFPSNLQKPSSRHNPLKSAVINPAHAEFAERCAKIPINQSNQVDTVVASANTMFDKTRNLPF